MNTDIKICVVGLGYVGLPLAVAFAEKYKVIGCDNNEKRIKELKSNIDSTLEIESSSLQKVSKNINYISSLPKKIDCNVFIISVPTPVDDRNRPDFNPLINASKNVGAVLKKQDIVIYESTVYPGVTEEICIPTLENSSGLIFNQDFFCGYSPERINPGDKLNTLENIVKVTSGSTPEIAIKINQLYESIIKAGTHMVSSIRIAEASKVIENTQRDVNLALINEFAMMFDILDIETQEVLEASATKWNFINLKPGLVGGHCIGVDPYYLTYKAEEIGYKPNLILASRQINDSMSKYIAEKTIKLMIKSSKVIKGSNVLILGITFKEDCPDTRNSQVFKIIKEIEEYGANVDVYDPLVNQSKNAEFNDYKLIANPINFGKKYDAIIVCVAHSEFKNISTDQFNKLSNAPPLILDVKSIVDNYSWRL